MKRKTLLPYFCGILTLMVGGSAIAQERWANVTDRGSALVTETVTLQVKQGEGQYTFGPLPRTIDPRSVLAISVDPAVKVLSQEVMPPLVTQDDLLAASVGGTVETITGEGTPNEKRLTAKILSSGRATQPQYQVSNQESVSLQALRPLFNSSSSGPYTTLLEADGKVRFSIGSIPLEFPAEAKEKLHEASIRWRINSSKAGVASLTVSYVMTGLGWSAQYSALLNPEGDKVELLLTAALSNISNFPLSKTKVNILTVPPETRGNNSLPALISSNEVVYSTGFSQQPPKQIYFLNPTSLPVALDIPGTGTVQSELLRSKNVIVTKTLLYEGAVLEDDRSGRSYGPGLRTEADLGLKSRNDLFWIHEIENSAKNGLGQPLASGTMYVFEQSKAGMKLLGTGQLDSSKPGEMIKIRGAAAAGIIGERKRTNFQISNNYPQVITESFAITLRNNAADTVNVFVVEQLYRGAQGTISNESSPYETVDPNTIRFLVNLKKGEEKKITYTVRYGT